MKTFLPILLFALGVCFCEMADAQNYTSPAVEISKETANIGGKIYYVHKVETKQTVYSICRAYGIQQSELEKENPSLKDGLKDGSLVFIPVNRCNIQDSAKTQTDKTGTGAKVAAAASNVSGQGKAASSDAATGSAPKYSKGGKAQGKTAVENRDNVSAKYVEHTVKWYETIYSISRKYGVTVERIMEFNNLLTTTIKRNEVLRIPVNGTSSPEDEDKIDTKENNDASAVAGFSTAPDNEDALSNAIPEKGDEAIAAHIKRLGREHHYTASSPMVITLVLPFKSQTAAPSSNYLDFYSGALMALRKAKSDGRHVKVNVIDLSVNNIAELLADDESISNSDIVIGPVEAVQIPQFAAFCQKKKIPMVSPMDHKADTLGRHNPCFFQMPVSQHTQLANLAARLSPSAGEEVLMVYNSAPGKDDKAYINNLRNALKEHGIQFKEMSYTIQSGRTIDATFRSKLSHKGRYKVVVASEEEAFASDIVRNMNLLRMDSIHVHVFGSAKLRNFEAIDSENLYNLNYGFSSNYFVDYGNAQTKEFILGYRALYKAEPSPWSFHGYDTFTFFISALDDLGDYFFSYIDHYKKDLLQSSIKFGHIGTEEGYHNLLTRDVELCPGLIVKVRTN